MGSTLKSGLRKFNMLF